MACKQLLILLPSLPMSTIECIFRLGLLVFLIGLWSSFEHRKLSHIPSDAAQGNSSLNLFNFIGIILCIFGLLFFILCVISCLGINRENLNLLRASLIGQIVSLLLFFIFAIVIFIWANKGRQIVAHAMLTGLRSHYHIDEDWTVFFDKLHLSYFCCGKHRTHHSSIDVLHVTCPPRTDEA